MLTESNGEHLLNSGDYNGKQWETNQKKTIEDFENEPDIIIKDVETDYPYRVMSLYHHLADNLSYLEDETNYFNEWIKQEGRDNVLYDAKDYLEEFFGYDTQLINTFNYECDLTQTIEFVGGKMFKDNIIALSIHNGADVRGGYTDYRIFRIMDENFYFWHEPSDEIKERISEEVA